MEALFTSPATCDVVARREIRHRVRQHTNVWDQLLKFYQPVMTVLGGRGKLKRGEAVRAGKALHARLSTEQAIVGLDISSFENKLSGRERCDVAFIQSVQDVFSRGEDNWISFNSNSVSLTRHQLVVFERPRTFLVSHHAMSRYMQRERKNIDTFFREVPRSMKTVLPLVPTLLMRANQEVAVPFGSGLLLGRFECHDAAQLRGTPAAVRKFVFEQGGAHDLSEDAEGCIIPHFTPSFVMRTYIGREEVDRYKSTRDLHRALVAFEDDNAEKILRLADVVFTEIPRADVTKETMRPLFHAAKQLVEGAEWLAQFPDARPESEETVVRIVSADSVGHKKTPSPVLVANTAPSVETILRAAPPTAPILASIHNPIRSPSREKALASMIRQMLDQR